MPFVARDDDAEDLAARKGLGLAIRKLRGEKGISSAVLAERAGLTEEQLSRVEAGVLDARWGTLRKIAYALEVPLSALLEKGEELGEAEGG